MRPADAMLLNQWQSHRIRPCRRGCLDRYRQLWLTEHTRPCTPAVDADKYCCTNVRHLPPYVCSSYLALILTIVNLNYNYNPKPNSPYHNCKHESYNSKSQL